MSMLPHSLVGQDVIIPSNMICRGCGRGFRVAHPKKGEPCPICDSNKTEPKKPV